MGHRVVHGAEEFTGSVLITDEVLETIERVAGLAPLHNPPNLAGIRAAQQALPRVPQVACFDTAFHTTIPPVAYTYALPYELCEQYRHPPLRLPRHVATATCPARGRVAGRGKDARQSASRAIWATAARWPPCGRGGASTRRWA